MVHAHVKTPTAAAALETRKFFVMFFPRLIGVVTLGLLIYYIPLSASSGPSKPEGRKTHDP
jgi:hypothetical protein